MVKRLTAVLAAICLACLALPVAASECDDKSQDGTPTAFAENVLGVAKAINENYFVELPQGELIDWAVRGLFRRVGEDVPADLEERLHKVAGMRAEELRAFLIDVRQSAELVQKLPGPRYLDLALEEMTRHLDGRTVMAHGEHGVGNLVEEPVGIGIELRSDPSTGMLQVITPLWGGAAYKAGIRAGDLVTLIAVIEKSGGRKVEVPEPVPTNGMSPTAAMKYLLGDSGSRVRLSVRRAGMEQPTECIVARHGVDEESVLGYRRKEDDSWDFWIDVDKRLAYIRLPTFGRHTAVELEKVLATLRKESLAGLVLDLRFNPGGWLNTSVRVADLFIDDGLIVTIRRRGVAEMTFYGKHEGSCLHFPLVCLVNEETARASEVVAACLQDHRRAVVMGERSKGDGAVVNTVPVNGDMEFLVSAAVFYRPSGKKLHKASLVGVDDDEWGVSPEPRHVLRLPFGERQELAEHLQRQTYIWPREQYGKEHGPAFKDRLLDMALAYLRTATK
jgi:carboxyl-terminal processing protease